MPKVSIIVPIYNSEKCLSRCIESILVQKFTDFELLLVDDGSLDRSGEICDEYAYNDLRIKVFHKGNGGASSARNLGLSKAEGEWIAFVDSDDYLLPSFLDVLIRLIKNDTDLCICGIIPDYSISSEYKITKTSFEYEGDVQRYLLLNNCQMSGSLCNKLFKRTYIKENQLYLNETIKYREDEEFLLRYMSYVQRVSATEKELYVYIVPNFYKYNNSENLQTSLSMYCSVVKIYAGKANKVTDYYQTELYNELLTLLRVDKQQTLKMMRKALVIIGWRIFRFAPFKAVCNKVFEFIRKQ